jgi:hypothetical protein
MEMVSGTHNFMVGNGLTASPRGKMHDGNNLTNS